MAAQVNIDYEQFPIWCKFCINFENLVKDYEYFKAKWSLQIALENA